MPLGSDDMPPESHQLRSEFWRLWQASRSEREHLVALSAEVQGMRNSRSWRVTAPLRRLMAGWRTGIERQPLAAIPESVAWSRAEIRQRAPWLSLATPAVALDDAPVQRLFVDVTALAIENHRGGIQRVVERILVELALSPPPGRTIVPVCLEDVGRYVEANDYLCRFLGLPAGALGANQVIAAGVDDVFLGLDLVRDHPGAAGAQRVLQQNGARVVVVMYDLLPLQHPEWFPAGVPERFRAWFETVALSADQIVCISAAVEAELRSLLGARLDSSPEVGRFQLGADFAPMMPHLPVPLPSAPRRQRVLTVGTVEPRKGHELALAVMERLWAKGSQAHWIIAGREGWDVAELGSRLRRHPEQGRRLHWFEQADDALLAALYRESGTLLIASHGEGFGLPVVEAMRSGCRLVLRDLPVFREVAGDHAEYFDGNDAAVVAGLLEEATRDPMPGNAEVIRTSGWAQSAASLIQACGLDLPASAGNAG